MHMEKKSSIKLIIIEMQVKAAIRCHLSPIKSIFKNFNDIQCWEWEMFFLTSLPWQRHKSSWPSRKSVSINVSRTIKFFIADSLGKQRVQFQKEEEVVSIQRNLQDASTRYKMWTFVWILIQAIWLWETFLRSLEKFGPRQILVAT